MKRCPFLKAANLLVAGMLAILVCAVPATAAQCSNTTRSAQVKAGGTGQLFSTCLQITFSVAGSSASTPDKCESGSAFYHKTVYACAGASPCTNCKNHGYKVPIDVMSGGGCPDTSGLVSFIGGSWDDWSGVPEALAKAISCTKPKNNPTWDWSAQTNDCPKCEGGDSPPEKVTGETYEGQGTSVYVYWSDPLDTFPFASADPQNLFLSEFERAEVNDPALVGGFFEQAVNDNGQLAGVSMTATVETLNFDEFGNKTFNTAYNLQGDVTANGHFDVKVSWGVDKGDGTKPVAFTRRETYNGQLLTSADGQGGEGNVFERTAADMAGVLEPIRPAFEWVHDPFSFPMFPGIELELIVGPDSNIFQRIHQSPEGSFVGSEFEFLEVEGKLQPIRTTIYGPDGKKREEYLFEDYQPVKGASNSSRPSSIKHVYYTGSAGSQERTEVLFTVRSSGELNSSQSSAVPAPYGENQPWQIWL